jgi:hypothetical protein
VFSIEELLFSIFDLCCRAVRTKAKKQAYILLLLILSSVNCVAHADRPTKTKRKKKKKDEKSLMEDFTNEYTSLVLELTFNSKPIINTLTQLAGEHTRFARIITDIIFQRLQLVRKISLAPLFFCCQPLGYMFTAARLCFVSFPVAVLFSKSRLFFVVFRVFDNFLR